MLLESKHINNINNSNYNNKRTNQSVRVRDMPLRYNHVNGSQILDWICNCRLCSSQIDALKF